MTILSLHELQETQKVSWEGKSLREEGDLVRR